MRLFLHIINLPLNKDINNQLTYIKPVINHKNPINSIVFVQIHRPIFTSDELMQIIQQNLQIKAQFFVFRILIMHRMQYKRIRILKGIQLQEFMKTVTQSQQPISMYQIQMEIQQLQSRQEMHTETQQKHKQGDNISKGLSQIIQQIYGYNNRLSQAIQYNELLDLQNLMNTIIYLKKQSILKNLFLLYNPSNGLNLLHTIIFHRHHSILEFILKNYSSYININAKSADGMLPLQLALKISNFKAIQLMINYDRQGLNYNCKTNHGYIICNVIDCGNFDQILKIIAKVPFSYEQIQYQLKMSLYDYIWSKSMFTDHQKTLIIKFLHVKHLELYDFYRTDRLLHFQCQKYVPNITQESIVEPQSFQSSNLKILSGQIIKCRSPPQFSKKIFFSANSYIGALEQYNIDSNCILKNDLQRLDSYKKNKHISFEQIKYVQALDQKQKTWYMKKQLFYFVVQQDKSKTIYGCGHQHITNQWISEINQAINAWKTHKSKQYNSTIKKKYISIVDMQIKTNESKITKEKEKHYIQLFTKRLSICEPLSDYQLRKQELQIEILRQKSKSYANITASTATNQQSNLAILKYSDFKMLQMLGQGSFGQVFLVQHVKNKKLYALKTLQKKKIILSKQTKFIISQVNILKQIKHPYIITLHFTFQTPNFIYLGLQYCQGKDLAKHINQQFVFKEEDVKIYAAQIVLALQYLHRMGIIYRDLKPENIMLGKDGHVLLVDFGLSKKTQNNFAKTFCGSPAYISPEMLQKKGVSNETDFFSLGIVIYELLFGEPPFFADNIHQLYENIQKGFINFPQKIKPVVKNLIQNLLAKQPKKRLGSNSIEQIKNHAFFQSIDWQKLYKKELKAPKRVLLDQIQDIQNQEQLINMFHNDFDYSPQNYKINRFKNFSFTREDQFL